MSGAPSASWNEGLAKQDPPMQQAAAFNLDEVKRKVEEMMKRHKGQ